jgi:hypothetical protein
MTGTDPAVSAPVRLNKVDRITNGNYFGGEEYIPEHEGREMTLSEATGGESAQQTFRSALADGEGA